MTLLTIYLLFGTPLFLISLAFGLMLSGIEYHGWMYRGHNNFWVLLLTISLSIVISVAVWLCWPIAIGCHLYLKFTNEMDDRGV